MDSFILRFRKVVLVSKNAWLYAFNIYVMSLSEERELMSVLDCYFPHPQGKKLARLIG